MTPDEESQVAEADHGGELQPDCRESLPLLTQGAAALGLKLDKTREDMFAAYCSALQAANRAVNLTALRTAPQIMTGLFLDSLTIAPALGEFIDFEGRLKVVDVGSGAGVPGLALKILYPQWQLTLIESIGKKAKCLANFVSSLKLTDTQVLAQRAEEGGWMPQFRDSADVCLARAVAPLVTLVELCGPLVRPGGLMAFPKGAGWELEMEQAELAAGATGSRFRSAYDVPTEVAADHVVVVYEKTKPTPGRYPRRIGLARSQPIGADATPGRPRGSGGRRG